tara:strand:+ start:520 stop:2937 length:2418 start_codon:yes stop_codon:yes gene_type:complete
MAQFDPNQTAVEYGESLLASREKSRKKASKRSRQIKRVNQVLAAFQIGDMFLHKRAQNRVEDMTNQFTVDKANALNRINQATKFRDNVLNKYTGVVDWDDPESWKKGGAIHRAVAEQHAAKFRTGRGTGTQKGLDKLDPESFEEQMREAVIADGTLETLRRTYNKHKGYLGQTTKGVEEQYKSLIKNATKQIMNPQNTSTLRKLLGKVGLTKDLNADLRDVKLGTGRTIKLDENTIKQYTSDFGRKTSEAVKLQEEVTVMINNTGKSRKEILKEIRETPPTPFENQTLAELFPQHDDRTDTVIFGAKTVQDEKDNLEDSKEEFVDYLTSLKLTVPITRPDAEGNVKSENLEDVFEDYFTKAEQTMFYDAIKEELKDDIIRREATIDPLDPSPARVQVDEDMVREATKRAIGRITFAKDEDGQEIVFKDSGRFFGFGDTRADLIVIPVDEYRVIKERIEEPKGTTTGTTTGTRGTTRGTTTGTRGTTTGTFKLPTFDRARTAFQAAINKKDDAYIKELFPELIKDYPDNTDELMEIYSNYQDSKQRAVPPPSPTTIDKKPTTVEELTAIGRGSRPTGAEYLGKGIVWAGSKSIISQDKTRLQRYAETGKISMHLKPTLEKYDLPADASPEVVADMLLTTSEITGKNITELAIQTVADVLPDSENAKQFLTEIAEVESKYGTHRKTFKKQDSSGIFQIDRIAFDEVQRRLQPDADVGENIRNYNEKLKEELGIDLTTASFSDLNTPLYGAAFARAYLLSVPESIPTTLKARAAYWKKYYNTSAGAGTVDKYLKRVTATTSLLNRNPS